MALHHIFSAWNNSQSKKEKGNSHLELLAKSAYLLGRNCGLRCAKSRKKTMVLGKMT
jgi:hypothetical protein